MQKNISSEEYKRGALKLAKRLLESKKQIQEEIKKDVEKPEFQQALKLLRNPDAQRRNKIIRL